MPGGALEALNADPNQIRLVLNRRKGFIKLALRFGSDLVPTFSFGETFIYDQVQTYGNYFNLHKINFLSHLESKTAIISKLVTKKKDPKMTSQIELSV